MLNIVRHFALLNVIEHVVDNYIFDKVRPVEGSIVYVDFIIAASAIQHSGVYVGKGMIVHLNANGKVEMVTHEQFVKGWAGLKCGSSIYVSCNSVSPVGSSDCSDTAMAEIDNEYEYNVIKYNCHQFTLECLQGCVLGHGNHIQRIFSTLTGLKMACRENIDSNNWRVWDR